MLRPLKPIALSVLLTCAALPAHADDPGVVFSAAKPGDALPGGWQNRPVVSGKTPTRYALVAQKGTTVLQADASSAASGLVHEGDVDLSKTPVVEWRWKVAAPIPGADNKVGDKEDAPARLVFFFDGRSSNLSIGERAEALAASAAGEKLPYATLMYIWTNSAPVGTVIPNPHTSRVQMIVVGNEPGKWQTLRRNVVSDFQKVFREAPGKLTGYGVMTDTDNTGTTARAWYGDIAFKSAR
ncbi:MULTISPECIES: DUF3047 domain-containing protein [unclassified Cupriavidus]|uniref:DUF3047 domain-containing protein n=1 Tax=unclassified Cupriavidus TaxID=2640874 RepID=UPI0028B8569D|nr:DUF3047 domain-containing protein [Cupriavidus sp. SZY C1]MDT6963770.1 DUF3047 domain-containing protein [Cupriavidus sp. SZY C1]